jgi:hypothetical protein
MNSIKLEPNLHYFAVVRNQKIIKNFYASHYVIDEKRKLVRFYQPNVNGMELLLVGEEKFNTECSIFVGLEYGGNRVGEGSIWRKNQRNPDIVGVLDVVK